MKNKFSATEVLLMFNASRSNRTFMNIQQTEEETALFMITPATMDAIKADKIKSLTFSKQAQALPRVADPAPGSDQLTIDRVKQQQEAYDKGHRTFGWRPEGMEETELVELERAAKMISFKVTIKKGERELRELDKEVA